MNHFFLANFNFEFHQRLGQFQLQTLHQGLFKKFCLLPKWPSSIARYSQIWRFKTFFSHFWRLEISENNSLSRILVSLFGEIWLLKKSKLGPSLRTHTTLRYGGPVRGTRDGSIVDVLYRVWHVVSYTYFTGRMFLDRVHQVNGKYLRILQAVSKINPSPLSDLPRFVVSKSQCQSPNNGF